MFLTIRGIGHREGRRVRKGGRGQSKKRRVWKGRRKKGKEKRREGERGKKGGRQGRRKGTINERSKMSEQEQGRVGGTGTGQRKQWDKGEETYQEAVVESAGCIVRLLLKYQCSLLIFNVVN